MRNESAAAILTRLLEQTGTSQRKLAERIGVSPQLLNSRLKKDSFPANDWLTAVRAIGFEVLVDRDQGMPEESCRKVGVCPAFKKTVDGVTYDKATSDAIGHQWFDGGVRELYKSENGRYFVLTQLCWPTLRATVQPVSELAAADFVLDEKTVTR